MVLGVAILLLLLLLLHLVLLARETAVWRRYDTPKRLKVVQVG